MEQHARVHSQDGLIRSILSGLKECVHTHGFTPPIHVKITSKDRHYHLYRWTPDEMTLVRSNAPAGDALWSAPIAIVYIDDEGRVAGGLEGVEQQPRGEAN